MKPVEKILELLPQLTISELERVKKYCCKEIRIPYRKIIKTTKVKLK